jgi:hypothetical protein
MGATSDEDDPSVSSGIGEQLSVMLDPTPLLAAQQFRVVGSSQVAGRATILPEAVPAPLIHGVRRRAFELDQLGSGADLCTLQVDAAHYEIESTRRDGVPVGVIGHFEAPGGRSRALWFRRGARLPRQSSRNPLVANTAHAVLAALLQAVRSRWGAPRPRVGVPAATEPAVDPDVWAWQQ